MDTGPIRRAICSDSIVCLLPDWVAKKVADLMQQLIRLLKVRGASTVISAMPNTEDEVPDQETSPIRMKSEQVRAEVLSSRAPHESVATANVAIFKYLASTFTNRHRIASIPHTICS